MSDDMEPRSASMGLSLILVPEGVDVSLVLNIGANRHVVGTARIDGVNVILKMNAEVTDEFPPYIRDVMANNPMFKKPTFDEEFLPFGKFPEFEKKMPPRNFLEKEM